MILKLVAPSSKHCLAHLIKNKFKIFVFQRLTESSNLYATFILKITKEIIRSRKFTNSNINQICKKALKNPESLNQNRLKEEVENLKANVSPN